MILNFSINNSLSQFSVCVSIRTEIWLINLFRVILHNDPISSIDGVMFEIGQCKTRWQFNFEYRFILCVSSGLSSLPREGRNWAVCAKRDGLGKGLQISLPYRRPIRPLHSCRYHKTMSCKFSCLFIYLFIFINLLNQ